MKYSPHFWMTVYPENVTLRTSLPEKVFRHCPEVEVSPEAHSLSKSAGIDSREDPWSLASTLSSSSSPWDSSYPTRPSYTPLSKLLSTGHPKIRPGEKKAFVPPGPAEGATLTFYLAVEVSQQHPCQSKAEQPFATAEHSQLQEWSAQCWVPSALWVFFCSSTSPTYSKILGMYTRRRVLSRGFPPLINLPPPLITKKTHRENFLPFPNVGKVWRSGGGWGGEGGEAEHKGGENRVNSSGCRKKKGSSD